MAIIHHREELHSKPATDEQLKQIWPPWNALPAELPPDEKREILVFDGDTKHFRRPNHRLLFPDLRNRFPYLPLDRSAYNQALLAASRWTELTSFAHTTFDLHKSLMAGQWAFANADNQTAGRVAISRAAQEIRLIYPGLLKSKKPNLQNIQILEDRYAAYLASREQALITLTKLVFKIPGLRTGKVLPLYAQAHGVPNPPSDVPIHFYIARLDALGICSAARLKEFLREVLPRMGRKSRQDFYRISLRPHYGKEPYAALQVWLLENRPVFEHEQFDWQWSDIQKAADEKNIECPRTSLKQWASRHRLCLHLKRGPATLDDAGISWSKRLLSPAPVFGDVLRPVST